MKGEQQARRMCCGGRGQLPLAVPEKEYKSSEAGPGIHADQAVGGDRDHRDPGIDALLRSCTTKPLGVERAWHHVRGALPS